MITGNLIRRFRHLRDYKQEYMARKIGVSERTYRKMEKGEIPLSESRQQAALDALGATAEEVLKLDEKVVFNNTFHHQKGTGIVLNQVLPTSEKDLYERLLAEKEALLQQKDEEILFLRGLLGRPASS
jgi:transcriptional regulator with XRE-family HTH domain